LRILDRVHHIGKTRIRVLRNLEILVNIPETANSKVEVVKEEELPI
jgi:hypothetical protein